MIEPHIFARCQRMLREIEAGGWSIDLSGRGDMFLLFDDHQDRYAFETLEEGHAFFSGYQKCLEKERVE